MKMMCLERKAGNITSGWTVKTKNMLTQEHIEKLQFVIKEVPDNAREVLGEIFDEMKTSNRQKDVLMDGFLKISRLLDECNKSETIFIKMGDIVANTIKNYKNYE